MDIDIPDPTDWLQTPIPGLQALESSLRCQVCKELFTAPKVTSCGHTFCSLCIRRYLSTSSKCPTCMKPDEEPRLRDNILVSELVGSFNTIRKQLLDTLRAKEKEKEEEEEARRRRKAEEEEEEEKERVTSIQPRAEKRRPYDDDDDDDIMEDAEPIYRKGKRPRQDTTIAPRYPQETGPPTRRSTRTSSQRTNSRILSSQTVVILDSDDEFLPEEDEISDNDDFRSNNNHNNNNNNNNNGSRAKRKAISRGVPETPTKNSDMVACPICTRLKDKSKVEAHVNRCLEGKRSPSPTPIKATNGPGTPLKRQPVSFANIPKPQQRAPYTDEEKKELRLPKGNASLTKEADIRKKLREFGIKYDAKGKESKQVLWARLQEWTNMWNANLDSATPKSKETLRRELEAYERHQSTQKPSVVQDKGFERDAWSKGHRSEFEALVAAARKSAAARKKENGVVEAGPKDQQLLDSMAGVQAELNGIDSPEVVEA
ncbi:E3 ubiquitin-protein ligase rad18 [Orbilia blumenaviensis]|uniref:Postreplication repair E3 ubiquitin-protein ligase RAD18 n=1 Tax=Orbilia blumenaviensis TaxID=1796055 RepID=A0AAV9VUB7_9PEZI